MKLFKFDCCNFYGSYLWVRSNQQIKRKLVTAYKRIFRGLMKLDLLQTTFDMISMNVDPFDVIQRKLNFVFRNRLLASENTIITVILNSSDFYCTPIYNMWCRTLL